MDYLKYYREDKITVNMLGNDMFPVIFKDEKVSFNCRFDNKLHIGQIILFYNPKYKTYVIHRIIKIVKMNNDNRYYVTKGDNNLNEDDYLVKIEDIRGVLYG